MNEKIVEQFQQKHESLAGIVHLVSGNNAAVEKVVSILKEKEAGKIAIAQLPEDVSQHIEQKCAEIGIELLKPPFNNADLPKAFDTIQAQSPGPLLRLPKPAPSLNLPQTMPCAW